MGRILGLDFGLRRVGAAISDPGRSIASHRRSPTICSVVPMAA